jgi:hypothetical protein
MKYMIMFAGTTEEQEAWEKMPKPELGPLNRAPFECAGR